MTAAMTQVPVPTASPAQFKFTRGSWECEAIISNADTGNLIIHDAEHANRVYRLWERNQWIGK